MLDSPKSATLAVTIIPVSRYTGVATRGGAVRGFPVLRAEKCLHASSHDLCGSCRRPALAYSTGSQLLLASRAAAFSAMQQQRYELGPSRMQ